MGCALAFLPFVFALMFIAVLTIMDHNSTGKFILGGCVLGLLLWFLNDMLKRTQRGEQSIGDIESLVTQRSHPATRTTTHNVIVGVRAPREPHNWQDTVISFAPRAYIASLTMRALPPVISFCQDQTRSQRDCSICMEEFKNGELIQPFGVCVHEFHSSCVNSWLLCGKITCPVCRNKLPITITRGRL